MASPRRTHPGSDLSLPTQQSRNPTAQGDERVVYLIPHNRDFIYSTPDSYHWTCHHSPQLDTQELPYPTCTTPGLPYESTNLPPEAGPLEKLGTGSEFSHAALPGPAFIVGQDADRALTEGSPRKTGHTGAEPSSQSDPEAAPGETPESLAPPGRDGRGGSEVTGSPGTEDEQEAKEEDRGHAQSCGDKHKQG